MFDPAAMATPRQLASVRRIALDDGPERGTRALVFSTGGGLDFWVLSDRSLDIGPLWLGGMPVAWQHPAGFMAPGLHDADAFGGTGLSAALSGFLVTCGFDNIRRARGGLPMHGTLPLTPARLIAAGEEWDTGVLYVEGEVTKARLNGACLTLTRRVEAPVGGRTLRLIDRVRNIGPEPAPLYALYHLNFGYPALGPGLSLKVNGEEHTPTVETGPAECLEIAADGRSITVVNRPAFDDWPAFRAEIEADADSLGYLQLWSDLRARRNILSVEPCNCARNADGTSAAAPVLAPGEVWDAQLTIRFD